MPGRRTPRRIGLLGGSFNPAHEGHVHLSKVALTQLALDEVWWLVSPRNPLKKEDTLAEYALRLREAKNVAQGARRIRISDMERRLGTTYYSIDTVRALQERYPRAQFVWLIGADNLVLFHRWRRWRSLFTRIPIAVFDRAPFSHNALRSPAATAYRRYFLPESQAQLLPELAPPAWTFVFMKRHPASATTLRKKLGKGAFLAHNKNG